MIHGILSQPMSTNQSAPIACVTGGNKGIGKAIALGLARDGYDIWLNYRGDDASAQSTADEIKDAGRHSLLLKFDVSDEQACSSALTPLLRDHTPAVLVSNAGFTRDGLLAMMDLTSWKEVLSVHLDGFFLLCRAILPQMIRKRRGRIVVISSTAGQSGLPGQTSYAAAKAGLMGAMRSLAAEVGRRGILVNAVAPGFIATDMTSGLDQAGLSKHIPLGRFGLPEEVAAAVRFLCSERANYITGQVLSVNGGLYM